MVPSGGLEPPLHGLRTRRAALTPRRDAFGANDRIRTDTSRLGRPAGSRYPTFALSTPSVVKDRVRFGTAGGQQGIRTQASPLGRSVLQTAGGPSARTARVGDSARIRTRTHEIWRLGCFRYTTLSFPRLDSSVDAALLSDLAPATEATNQKKAF